MAEDRAFKGDDGQLCQPRLELPPKPLPESLDGTPAMIQKTQREDEASAARSPAPCEACRLGCDTGPGTWNQSPARCGTGIIPLLEQSPPAVEEDAATIAGWQQKCRPRPLKKRRDCWCHHDQVGASAPQNTTTHPNNTLLRARLCWTTTLAPHKRDPSPGRGCGVHGQPSPNRAMPRNPLTRRSP